MKRKAPDPTDFDCARMFMQAFYEAKRKTMEYEFVEWMFMYLDVLPDELEEAIERAFAEWDI